MFRIKINAKRHKSTTGNSRTKCLDLEIMHLVVGAMPVMPFSVKDADGYHEL